MERQSSGETWLKKKRKKENSRLLQALPECCPSKQEYGICHIPVTYASPPDHLPSPKTTGAKPRRRARRQFPAALHSPNQTLMRSAQIKGGGERRNENSLRPQGRPNPIIPITPANHTLMMGIKMCWPRSSARQAPVQPSVSGFLQWWAAGGEGRVLQKCVHLCQFRHGGPGQVLGRRWAAESKKRNKRKGRRVTAELCAPTTRCSPLSRPPWHLSLPAHREKKKKGLWFTPSYSTLKREQFNPLKLPSWLPSEPLQTFPKPPVSAQI